MKNTQKGFAIPLIIALVALIAVGGGVYIYNQNSSDDNNSKIENTTTPSMGQPELNEPGEPNLPISPNIPTKPAEPTEIPEPVDQVVCTMDAMQCPDGSWIGRSGPNCEFVCPQIEIKDSGLISEPEKVYNDFKVEFEKTRNFDEALAIVMKYSTAEEAKQYAKDAEETPDELKEDFFNFMKMMAPPMSSITVTNVKVEGVEALLSVSTSDSTGTITLRKENGFWKIFEERWSGSSL